MSKEYIIDTPEQLKIKIKLAGLTRRVIASFIDTLISYLMIIALLSLLLLVVDKSKIAIIMSNTLHNNSFSEAFTAIFAIIMPFIIIFGYYIFFEYILNGQTPGKKILKLRVLQDDGTPISFTTVLIRNLLRTVDIGFGFIGVILIMFNPTQKRLGDLAGNSIVVFEETGELILPQLPQSNSLGIANVNLLTKNDYKILEQYLTRCKNFTPKARNEIGLKLRTQLEAILGTYPDTNLADVDYLQAVYVNYIRQSL